MILFTAHYHVRDRDRFDITRMGCDRDREAGKPTPGEFLAPSWKILKPVLDWRRAFIARCAQEGLDEQAEYFRVYRKQYRAEMLASWQTRRDEWLALLARDRVVLVCFCADPAFCHRTLAAGFLSSPKLGADYRGELTEADRIPPPPKMAVPPAVLLGDTRGKCTPFLVTDGGLTGFVCGDRVKLRRCVGCGKTAALLCDYPRDEKTCDAPICASCAREVGEDRHHCPTHAKEEPAGKAVAEAAPGGQVGWGW